MTTPMPDYRLRVLRDQLWWCAHKREQAHTEWRQSRYTDTEAHHRFVSLFVRANQITMQIRELEERS